MKRLAVLTAVTLLLGTAHSHGEEPTIELHPVPEYDACVQQRKVAYLRTAFSLGYKPQEGVWWANHLAGLDCGAIP